MCRSIYFYITETAYIIAVVKSLLRLEDVASGFTHPQQPLLFYAFFAVKVTPVKSLESSIWS